MVGLRAPSQTHVQREAKAISRCTKCMVHQCLSMGQDPIDLSCSGLLKSLCALSRSGRAAAASQGSVGGGWETD
eukprot:26749-Alexandrium_andersonii.AAC.1